MSSTDIDYYRERANAERGMVLAASQQNVAAIHEELARQYQALVDQSALRPKLRIRFAGEAAPEPQATASSATS